MGFQYGLPSAASSVGFCQREGPKFRQATPPRHDDLPDMSLLEEVGPVTPFTRGTTARETTMSGALLGLHYSAETS